MIWLMVDSSGIGGIERHIATLAQSFKKRGIAAEVILFGKHGENPWLRQLEAANLSVRILDNSFSSLVSALKQHRPVLLHTHGYKAGILGRIAARLKGIPVVSTFHSGEQVPFPVNIYFLLDRYTAFLARGISVSKEIRDRIPFTTSHIPNYVLPPDSPPTGPLPRRVGFVGRLSHEKAPDLFCQLARSATNNVEWHVYGDGPMRAGLEQRYGDCVTFHGVVTDLDAVWRNMGLMLMPSRFEGLPLAALEALGHGIPVLASHVGALPDVVKTGKTGWTFQPEDMEGAKAGLESWLGLGEQEQASMRQACRIHLSKEFSEEKRLSQLLEVYRAAGLSLP